MLGQTISTIVIIAVAYAVFAWFRRRGYPQWWPRADGQDSDGTLDDGEAGGGHEHHHHHDGGFGGFDGGDSGGHHHG